MIVWPLLAVIVTPDGVPGTLVPVPVPVPVAVLFVPVLSPTPFAVSSRSPSELIEQAEKKINNSTQENILVIFPFMIFLQKIIRTKIGRRFTGLAQILKI
jgi:hypothetical protein